MIIEILMCGDY